MIWRWMIALFLQAQSKPPEYRVADIFKPLATPGESEKQVAYLTFAITGAIFVVVASLIVYTIVKFRRRADDSSRQEPPQVYGSNQIEVAWTVIPILIVFVLIGVSARVIAGVQNASPPKDALHVRVVGHQWWWEVEYPDYHIRGANEIHVPVSTDGHRATYVELQSADVIHSFWLPQLSGKTDAIPNRTNYAWLDPKKRGVYFGNCAEYCGTQHANMLLRVIADDPEEFKGWAENQQRQQKQQSAAQTTAGGSGGLPPVQPISTQSGINSEVAKNQAVYESLACVNCHMIQGTTSIGKFGPDLTHLMSRGSIGAGVIENTHENLRKWVDNPQDIKPGCLMPSFKLTDRELDQVVAYLETLK